MAASDTPKSTSKNHASKGAQPDKSKGGATSLDELDEALKDSFPASDPPSPVVPSRPGKPHAKKKAAD